MAYIRDTPTTVTVRTALAAVVVLACAVTLLVLARDDAARLAITGVVLVAGSLVVTWAVWRTDVMSVPADRSSPRLGALAGIGIGIGTTVIAVTDGLQPVQFGLFGFAWLFVAIVNHNLRFVRQLSPGR